MKRRSDTAIEDRPVVLECAMNGSVSKKNPHAPSTVREHITEMMNVLEAGATIAHNHSNEYHDDPEAAAEFYAEVYRPVREKYPHAVIYPTVNLDAKLLHEGRCSAPPGAACGHQRVLAKAGLANMVMLDTSATCIAVLGDDGVAKEEPFYVYQLWPEDVRFSMQICEDFGCGASVGVYEPGWLKNVVAMARAGTLPRGSRINFFFAADHLGSMAPPIPEALDLYLKMMEGLDLEWSVGCPEWDRSVMDTPLARMALERGGGLRVGLEDHATGPSNVEQIERAKELIAEVGREVISGPAAIEYLDIPFAATRPAP